MIFHINEGINSDLVNRLIAAYNQKPLDEGMDIYMSSLGGSVWSAQVLVDIVSAQPNTTLIAYGNIASSAVYFFTHVQCEKKMLDSCYFVLHQSSWSVEMKETMAAVSDDDKIKIKLLKDYGNTKTKEICEIYRLTEEEKEKIRVGKDVYITQARLKKIFKKT